MKIINKHSISKLVNNLVPSEIPDGYCKCGCGENTRFVRNKYLLYFEKHNRSTCETTPFYKIDLSTGCWIWLRTAHEGYGNLRLEKRMWKAHIAYYTIYKGEIEDGLLLDHLCKNTLCVNPEHLEPVTHLENIHRGNVTKLTKEQVLEIRKLYKEKAGGYGFLSKMFGVSRPQIAKIIKRISWSHL